jgi:hypothetical protein
MPSQRSETPNYSRLDAGVHSTNSAAIALLAAAATGCFLVPISIDVLSRTETLRALPAEVRSSARTYVFASPQAISVPNPTIIRDGIGEGVDSDPLAGFEALNEHNWDGYGAEPISAETLQYARQLLTVMPEPLGPPDIAPAGDGSITLEWVPDDHPKLHKLFLDIGPGEKWRAYWKLRSGEFGRRLGASFTSETAAILKTLFDDLSR